MYEQQKRRIIADYLLSPRCYRSVRAKPNRQFSSWKNRLNPDITQLSNKINAAKNQYCNHQNRTPQMEKWRLNQEDVSIFNNRSKNRKQESWANPEYYGNLDTLTKTPKTCETYRYSREPHTGKPSLLSKDKLSMTSLELKDESLKSNDKTLESPNIIMDQDILNQIKDQLNDVILPQVPSSKNLNERQKSGNGSSINEYHMKLKEEERLYLLEKFMQHYEKIHKFKL